MQKVVLVPLAKGFEELEAVTIIDVLRRAGARVVVAGLDSTTLFNPKEESLSVPIAKWS